MFLRSVPFLPLGSVGLSNVRGVMPFAIVGRDLRPYGGGVALSSKAENHDPAPMRPRLRRVRAHDFGAILPTNISGAFFSHLR